MAFYLTIDETGLCQRRKKPPEYIESDYVLVWVPQRRHTDSVMTRPVINVTPCEFRILLLFSPEVYGLQACRVACIQFRYHACCSADFSVSVRPLRNSIGVTVGVLLTLLYYGNLIHPCGYVELNPGPDRKTDGTRQTLLDSVTGGTTQRHSSRSRSRKDSSWKDIVERTGSTPETLTGLPSDPSLSDVMSMLTNLCLHLHQTADDILNRRTSGAVSHQGGKCQ
ncbi:hypothetical protein ACOMHN_007854 [Nucella lapillus]